MYIDWIIATLLVLQFISLQLLKIRMKKKNSAFAKKHVHYSTIGGLLIGLIASILAHATLLQSLFIILFSGLYFYLSLYTIYRKHIIRELKEKKEK
ncbi:MAG: hypothetical protein Q8934_17760 [Bacillota bacterium]|nr:hypothetical protein [Bacillota bacterium]